MWTKLDDGFLDHPKIAAIGPLGLALDVSAMVYCGRQLTDGYVPSAVIPRLVDLTGVARELPDVRGNDDVIVTAARVYVWELVDLCVTHDVWHDTATILDCPPCLAHWPSGKADGFYIHDYLVYNLTREKVLRDREAAKKRRAKKEQDSSPSVGGTSGDVRVMFGDPAPAPAPAPEPSRSRARQKGADAPENPKSPNDIQTALLTRLHDSEGWESLTFGAIVGLNGTYTRPVVTMALQRAREENQAPNGSAYGLIEAMCKDISAKQEGATA